MEQKQKKIKINSWDESDELLILDIWDQYEDELRTCKRNSEVYERMASETNGKFTAQEVHLKIRNLREKYRAENIRIEASRNPFSEWTHYNRVHQILQNNAYNNDNILEVQIKTDPTEDPLGEEAEAEDHYQDDIDYNSPIPSPTSEATLTSATKKRKSRKEWKENDNLKVLQLWEEYALVLGKTRQNSHIYAEIAQKMKKFSAYEVHMKIRNLVQKYRVAKKELESSNLSCSEWIYYDRVDKIMKKRQQKSNKRPALSVSTHNEPITTSTATAAVSVPQNLPQSASSNFSADLSYKNKTLSTSSACWEPLQHNSSKKRRKRNYWDPADTLLILELWQKYEPEFRRSSRNSHVYVNIAKEMKGRFAVREVFNKIRNLTQKYRNERKQLESLQDGSISEWTLFNRVHQIIGDRPNSSFQENFEYGDNQDLNTDFLSFFEQSQSNSFEVCSPTKVSSSPINEPSPAASPFNQPSIVASPQSACSAASDYTSSSQKQKAESLQQEILDTLKQQTAVLQTLSEQCKNLNQNFEKFVQTQTETNAVFLKILQEIAKK